MPKEITIGKMSVIKQKWEFTKSGAFAFHMPTTIFGIPSNNACAATKSQHFYNSTINSVYYFIINQPCAIQHPCSTLHQLGETQVWVTDQLCYENMVLFKRKLRCHCQIFEMKGLQCFKKEKWMNYTSKLLNLKLQMRVPTGNSVS